MLKKRNLIQKVPLLFIFILISFLVIIPTKEVAADYDTFQYQSVQNIFVPQKIFWKDLCPRYYYGANIGETDILDNIWQDFQYGGTMAYLDKLFDYGIIYNDDFIYEPPFPDPDCFCGTDIFTILDHNIYPYISYPDYLYQNQNMIVDRIWDEMLPMPATGIAY